MFSKPKLQKNAKDTIDILKKNLDEIRTKPNCSPNTAEAIDQTKKIFDNLESNPQGIATLVTIFDADSFELLITDAHYRELFNCIIDFMQKNPPTQLFDSFAVKATFSAIESKWNEAIASLRITHDFCTFIAKSDDFGKKYKPDEMKSSSDEPYVTFLMKEFDKVNNLISETRTAEKELKNVTARLRTADAKNAEELSKEKDKALQTVQNKLESLVTEYNATVKNFITPDSSSGTSAWEKTNELPYYFMRGIMPEHLTYRIDKDDWSDTHMLFFGCREGILQACLDTEYTINDLAKRINPNTPVRVNSFIHNVEKRIQEESKQASSFKEEVDKRLTELQKKIADYLKPGRFTQRDARKLKIFSEFQKDLERCFKKGSEDDVGRKVKYAFKAVLRAALWHSKVLAEAAKSGKKLSSSESGKIINEYYKILFRLYFQLNETNSQFYRYAFPGQASKEKESAHTIAKTLSPALPEIVER